MKSYPNNWEYTILKPAKIVTQTLVEVMDKLDLFGIIRASYLQVVLNHFNHFKKTENYLKMNQYIYINESCPSSNNCRGTRFKTSNSRAQYLAVVIMNSFITHRNKGRIFIGTCS